MAMHTPEFPDAGRPGKFYQSGNQSWLEPTGSIGGWWRWWEKAFYADKHHAYKSSVFVWGSTILGGMIMVKCIAWYDNNILI